MHFDTIAFYSINHTIRCLLLHPSGCAPPRFSTVFMSIVITASACLAGSLPMLYFVMTPPPSSVSHTSIVRCLSAKRNVGARCIQPSIVVGIFSFSSSALSSPLSDCGHVGMVGSYNVEGVELVLRGMFVLDRFGSGVLGFIGVLFLKLKRKALNWFEFFCGFDHLILLFDNGV